METYFKREDIMKPGTPIPDDIREKIWDRCKGRCEYCGKKAVDPHHITYRSQGGNNSVDNLIALCRVCHEDILILQKIAKNPSRYLGRYNW